MAEWSNALDLRSSIFGCAGSNPAGTIVWLKTINYNIFALLAQSVEHKTFNLRATGSSPVQGLS